MIRAFVAIAGACALGACAGSNAGQQVDANPGADANSGDGPIGCKTLLTFNPAAPVASPVMTIRAVATTPVPGVVSYAWTISGPPGMIPPTIASPDGSQVDFIASTAGCYAVSVDVGGGEFCPGTASVFAMAPGAIVVDYRLRVTPPPNLALPLPNLPPPQDFILQVPGGADFPRSISLDPGLAVAGTVKNGSSGVPAYLRFMPVSSPGAFVETFTGLDGAFSVRLLGQPTQVLIVPTVPGIAPRIATMMPTSGNNLLTVSPGTAVSGVVRDAANAVLAGAKVQITVQGVPSTLATTASDGSFTVRAITLAGADAVVDVTPPPGRGFPRLRATGVFDLTQSVQVRYTGATCDLANTPVKRGAASLPLAKVTVVGTLASAGSVVAGITAPASGEVRIPTIVDGASKLPSVLVPRAQLSAVVAVSPTDLALVAIDVTGCAALAINAPGVVTSVGTVRSSALATLGGVRLDATPVGDLALADAPPVEVRTASNGSFTVGLASGGHYDLRFNDPVGRGGPVVALDALAGAAPTSVTLPRALHLHGEVTMPSNSNPIANAAVQALCLSCTGLDAVRPISETSTDGASAYSLAVPDPGTM